MEAIKVSNLSKRYKKSSRPSLDNVSLDLPQGCVLGLVGENGAGKTTLIKAITGSVKFDSGSIEVLGHDIDAASQNKTDDRFRQDIGTVLAEDSFPEIMTAGMIGNVMKSIYINWDSACYNRYLEKFGLDSKKKYKEYSRGMKMKLSIAVAMSHNAKLLLLDEHTAALDPKTAEKVLALSDKFIAEDKLTAMMITHNMHAALELGNRTLMMDSGHIVLDISGEERANTTVDGLLDQFAKNVGRRLDNDRILLSRQEETAQ